VAGAKFLRLPRVLKVVSNWVETGQQLTCKWAAVGALGTGKPLFTELADG
jgi:hypothetical protein